MLNSETLEVGIGMAFLFLLMALICTAVKEWIEGVLKWRAMDLERAMRTLLDDTDGTTTAYLYRHPLIYSLFQGRYDPQQLRSSVMTPGKGSQHMRLSKRRNLPSYIPAANFATAFLDIVGRGPVADGASDEQVPAGVALTVAALRERAAGLASPHLRRILLSAIDHCGGDLDRLRLNIQRWFDGTMDRASGWYRRRTQAVLFMLGIGAAVVLNVDALHVMERLTADKAFREVVVKEVASATAPLADAAASQGDRIGQARRAIQSVGMPVGWRRSVDESGSGSGWVPRQLCVDSELGPCKVEQGPAYGWLRIVVGWMVTALAVMLGAPFWFDVLNKFMVIRSTVKPHEKSPEEGSEDRPTKGGGATGGAAPAANAAPAPAATNPATAAPGLVAAAPPTQPDATATNFAPHQWRPGFVNRDEVSL